MAEWEQIDLRSRLQHCAQAYRSVHPGRQLDTELPGDPAILTCAPELLAQALDKLVDNAVSLTGDEDVVTLAIDPE